MAEKEKTFLTPKQAISVLGVSGKTVHTFRGGSGMIIGADWNLKSLKQTLNRFPDKIELTGDMARKMKHGIAVEDEHGYLFIQTDETKLLTLEKTLNK